MAGRPGGDWCTRRPRRPGRTNPHDRHLRCGRRLLTAPGNRDHLGVGLTLLAPFTAAVGLALVLLATLDEFVTLLGVDPTSGLRWQLPASYAVAAAAGIGWALILKNTKPQAYAAIGRGANSATLDLRPPT
jgi:hypothetical protein